MPEDSIQFHWRARVKFELLPPFLRTTILDELSRVSRNTPRGLGLQLEGRGWRVEYETYSGRLHVLDVEVW